MTKVELTQIANTREQMLFSVVILVMIALFFRMVQSPLSRKAQVLNGRITALMLEKDALIKFSSATPALEKGTTLSRKKGIKVKILLGEIKSSYPDVSSLLARITEAGFLGGAKVLNLSYLPTLVDKGLSKTDFTLDIRGSFTDIRAYLERLEQFPALFKLENVGFKIAEDQRQDLEVEILGRFFKLEAAPPDPAIDPNRTVGGVP